MESSGCGSSINLPSLVFFFSLPAFPDSCRPGGNGEGREEADVLAGALRRPKGSLCVVFDMRRMEPGEALCQPTASRGYSPRSTANPLRSLSNRQRAG